MVVHKYGVYKISLKLAHPKRYLRFLKLYKRLSFNQSSVGLHQKKNRNKKIICVYLLALLVLESRFAGSDFFNILGIVRYPSDANTYISIINRFISVYYNKDLRYADIVVPCA